MDFHDFPRVPGKSGCRSRPTPQVVCRPSADRRYAQSWLMFLTMIAVPWMLIPKPVYLYFQTSSSGHKVPRDCGKSSFGWRVRRLGLEEFSRDIMALQGLSKTIIWHIERSDEWFVHFLFSARFLGMRCEFLARRLTFEHATTPSQGHTVGAATVCRASHRNFTGHYQSCKHGRGCRKWW